jgi:DNA modification methylase
MQPYATQIIDGEIPFLLRSYPTKIRGEVLLLSSKKPDKMVHSQGIFDAVKYPLNSAIGVIEIADCTKIKRSDLERGGLLNFDKTAIDRYPKHLIKNESLYAWILKNPVKFQVPKRYKCSPSLTVIVRDIEILDGEEEVVKEEIESTSVWDFGVAERSAAHDLVDFHGWYPPQISKNCILRYSREDDLVLDCFVGSGTTLVECKKYNRRSIGIDINPKMVDIARRKVRCVLGKYEPVVLVGDARNFMQLKEYPILDESIDCIVTHPPYWKAIVYSKGARVNGDLSLDRTLDEFLSNMQKVFEQMYRALKPGKYCCVTIGDVGEGGFLIPLGFYLTKIGLDVGFKMKDIAIWVLQGERSLRKSNFRIRYIENQKSLLIKHNYVLIFQKPGGR